MAECSCPFLVNLVAAFNEGPYLYMLTKCIISGISRAHTESQAAAGACEAGEADHGRMQLPLPWSTWWLPSTKDPTYTC